MYSTPIVYGLPSAIGRRRVSQSVRNAIFGMSVGRKAKDNSDTEAVYSAVITQFRKAIAQNITQQRVSGGIMTNKNDYHRIYSFFSHKT